MVTGLSARSRRGLTVAVAALLLLLTSIYAPIVQELATGVESGTTVYAAHSTSGGD